MVGDRWAEYVYEWPMTVSQEIATTHTVNSGVTPMLNDLCKHLSSNLFHHHVFEHIKMFVQSKMSYFSLTYLIASSFIFPSKDCSALV
jgi:hypothetical protein